MDELERWQIRVPKTGNQGELRGEEAFVFDLDCLASDQLERTLRRVNPSRRRGVPIIYRGPRQLAADPLEDDDERLLVGTKTSERDPEEQATVLAIRELRDLRRTLGADCDARRRELDRLEASVTKAKEERDKELERLRNQVRAEEKHAQEQIAETRAHYDRELSAVRRTRGEIDEQATKDLKNIAEQITTVAEARSQVNKVLHAPTASDFLTAFKDNLVAISDSPLAEAVQAHLAARLAAAVSRRTTEPVSVDDVLKAFVLQGKAARARHDKLRELKFEDLCDTRRVELCLVGADFHAGTIDFKTLVTFVRHPTSVATT